MAVVGKHSIRTKLIISYVAVALLSLVVLGDAIELGGFGSTIFRFVV
mgnify:CR=1 FL=1